MRLFAASSTHSIASSPTGRVTSRGLRISSGRVAHADRHVSPRETETMEQLVHEVGGLSPDQAMLVVSLAKSSNLLFGATAPTIEWRVSLPKERPTRKAGPRPLPVCPPRPRTRRSRWSRKPRFTES